MSSNILMPALTPTMEEGSIVSWLVSEGDVISPGDVIAEIETDKSVIELESAEGGVVQQILIPEATEGVKVGSVIAIVGQEGDSAENINVRKEPGDLTDSAAHESETEHDRTAPAKVVADSTSRVIASPSARRRARDAGIDLSTVTGSGPNGRVINRDVEEEILRRRGSGHIQAKPEIEHPGPGTAPGLAPYEQLPLSNIRKIAATRLVESKQTIPHFYLKLDIEIDDLLTLRKRLNKDEHDIQLTINDFVIRAAALALRKIPDANVQFSDNKLIRFQRSDVAVAVAVKDGLVTPVIRNADNKTVVEISTEMKELTELARTGKLLPDDYKGGTFTISNLGMHDIDEFIAIINPPQAAILALGQGIKRAVVKHDVLGIATVMKATLSCDHRVLDGVVGAAFLNVFKDYIENPDSVL